MKINYLNNISFKRNIKIIDAHTHDKPVQKIGKEGAANDILKFLNEPFQSNEDTFTVTKMFPSSLDACFIDSSTGKPALDEIKGNKEILKTFKKTDVGNFLAVCQPKTGDVKNIEKLFKRYPNKFIGLKFHPEGLELEADSELYDSYLEFAKNNKLPCLFHSDRAKGYIYPDGGKVFPSVFSRPDQIYSLAKRHPDVPVIMAHCSGPEAENIEETINTIISSAKNKDAKLYADISWVDIDICDEITKKREFPNLINAIKKLENSEAGDLTDRLLFGTDAPIDRFNTYNAEINYKNYIIDINNAIKKNFGNEADSIIDKIFYKNANEVYIEKTWAKNIENAGWLSKISPLAFLGIGVIAGAVYVLKNKDHIFKKDSSKNNSLNAPEK